MSEKVKYPKLSDLITNSEENIKSNEWAAYCNQEPPKEWIKEHPAITGFLYLPIERIEWMLFNIFQSWWVEIREVVSTSTGVIVVVRVFAIHRETNEKIHQDGIGASFGNGLQMDTPAAETFAIKDAVEKWGRIFGKDLNRKEQISYANLINNKTATIESLVKDIYASPSIETLDKFIQFLDPKIAKNVQIMAAYNGRKKELQTTK